MTAAAELVPASNMADLETLDPQARELAVTHMLGEARSWLAHALESTEPRRVAEFKAFVATIAETSRQLNLSKEIQLDAQEMVRRAERGVGLAIRRGQEEGTVRAPQHGGGPRADYERNGRPVHVAYQGNEDTQISPTACFNDPKERSDVYAVTDDVTDEKFEQAIEEAKDEGNLSRANVARKCKDVPAKSKSERPEFLRKTRRLDAVRIITETVHSLDGLAFGVRLLDDLTYDVDPTELDAWVGSLNESLRSLNRLHRKLKELTQHG